MELSSEAARVINKAIVYAKDGGYEFVTPEMLLLELIDTGLPCLMDGVRRSRKGY